MKGRIVLYFILILIFIVNKPIIAQDIYTGINYSIGNIYYSRISDDENTTHELTNRGALMLEFSPFLSNFIISSGIEFRSNKFSNALSIPLTLRITVGQRLRPFIEGGAFYTYTLNDKHDVYVVKNDFGAKIGTGIIVMINKRWWIDAGYYRRYGFVSGLEEIIILPLETQMIESYRSKEGSFTIGVKHRF